MRKRKELSCSFCGKKESEVLKLVAGPRVYICDQCVVLAQRIMENTPGSDVQTSSTQSPFWNRLIALVRKFMHGGGATSRVWVRAVGRQASPIDSPPEQDPGAKQVEMGHGILQCVPHVSGGCLKTQRT